MNFKSIITLGGIVERAYDAYQEWRKDRRIRKEKAKAVKEAVDRKEFDDALGKLGKVADKEKAVVRKIESNPLGKDKP